MYEQTVKLWQIIANGIGVSNGRSSPKFTYLLCISLVKLFNLTEAILTSTLRQICGHFKV